MAGNDNWFLDSQDLDVEEGALETVGEGWVVICWAWAGKDMTESHRQRRERNTGTATTAMGKRAKDERPDYGTDPRF